MAIVAWITVLAPELQHVQQKQFRMEMVFIKHMFKLRHHSILLEFLHLSGCFFDVHCRMDSCDNS